MAPLDRTHAALGENNTLLGQAVKLRPLLCHTQFYMMNTWVPVVVIHDDQLICGTVDIMVFI